MLVSVIVPIYNVEKYLDECVSSITNQTYQNLEIILVDDGSPDNCPVLCDVWVKKDDRIKVVHKENAGAGFARNSGLEVATGEYVVFVDSDDWLAPEHIMNLLCELESKQVDVCFCNRKRFRSVNDCKDIAKPSYFYTSKEEIEENLILPMIGSPSDEKEDVLESISPCLALYRRNIIKKNKLLFPSEKVVVSEDLFFNLEYLHNCEKVCAISACTYYNRLNPNSITQAYQEKRLSRTIAWYPVMKQTVSVLNISQEKLEFRIERTFLVKIRVICRHIVQTDMPLFDKKHLLKEVLDVELLCAIIKEFPIKHSSCTLQIFYNALLRKDWVVIYLLLSLKKQTDKMFFLRNAVRKLRGLN